MPHNAELVILANSIKFGKHCVAGKLVNTPQWIRLVSDIQGSELDDSYVIVSNQYGNYPVKTLQKVHVNILSRVPLINQPENCLVDINTRWRQNYKISFSQLNPYLDMPDSLWDIGDRVSYTAIQNRNIAIQNSLFLVKVQNLRLFTTEFQGRVRPRAEFMYNNNLYNLSVTDPNFTNLLNKEQNYLEAILCISLGVPFNDYCYKIIASIFVQG